MCKITYERETIFKNLLPSENKGGARRVCPPGSAPGCRLVLGQGVENKWQNGVKQQFTCQLRGTTWVPDLTVCSTIWFSSSNDHLPSHYRAHTGWTAAGRSWVTAVDEAGRPEWPTHCNDHTIHDIPPPSKVVLHVKTQKNHKIFGQLSATLIVQLKMCWIGLPSCCDCC